MDLRFKSSPSTVNKIRILGNSEERKFEFPGEFGFPTQIKLSSDQEISRKERKSQNLFGLSRRQGQRFLRVVRRTRPKDRMGCRRTRSEEVKEKKKTIFELLTMNKN